MLEKNRVIFLFIVLSLTPGLSRSSFDVLAQGRRQFPTTNRGVNAVVPRYLLAEAESISGDRFRIATRTPAGVKILAVSEPSRAMLDAIDKGFTDLFAAARRENYRRNLSHGNYTVFIARSDRAANNDKATPAFAVGASQYAGTRYDRGGFIYAAGLVLDPEANAFIIAEHARDFRLASDAVRFEGEHIVLYHNDRRRFDATADHSRGGGHPILK